MEPPRRSTLRLLVLGLVVLAAILLPFGLFGDAMDSWAMDALSASGPRLLSALFVAGLLAADIVLPTPSSVVSTASGALLGFVPGALVGWTGMTLGCALGYSIGSAGRGSALKLVGEAGIHRAEALTAKLGDPALVVARAVPVLAEASVLLAGVGRMPIGRFALLTSLSNAGISLVYAAVGAFAADANSFLLAFGGAVLVPALGLALVRGLGVVGSPSAT